MYNYKLCSEKQQKMLLLTGNEGLSWSLCHCYALGPGLSVTLVPASVCAPADILFHLSHGKGVT